MYPKHPTAYDKDMFFDVEFLGAYICPMTEKELLSVDRESFHFLFKKVGELRAAEVRP